MDLVETANGLLAYVVAGLTNAGIRVPGKPNAGDNAGVVPGVIIASDGEQLTVAMQTYGIGFPGAPATQQLQTGQLKFFVTWWIQLLRVVAVVNEAGIPAMQKQAADAMRTLADAQTLSDVMVQLKADIENAGLPWMQRGIDNAFTIDAVGPEGGLSGNRVIFTHTII